jgi:hypothetical protein
MGLSSVLSSLTIRPLTFESRRKVFASKAKIGRSVKAKRGGERECEAQPSHPHA